MTKQTVSFEVEKRTVLGRKIKALRRQGILPGNIFGKKISSVAVQMPTKAFDKLFEEVGETGLINLTIKGEDKPRPALISNVHQDPIADVPLHVDFHQVDLTQKVTATIPLETVGESPAVKEKGATLLLVKSDLEVEALPTDLPEFIEVDISTLVEFGDSVLVKDLKIDLGKVTPQADAEETIAMVQEPKEEEPEPEAEEAPAEAETTVQKSGDDAEEGTESSKEESKKEE